jgi:hypothetical protein
MSPEEDTKLQFISFLPQAGFLLTSGLGSYLAWFGIGIGPSLSPSLLVTRYDGLL